jgi:hypothetical protein
LKSLCFGQMQHEVKILKDCHHAHDCSSLLFPNNKLERSLNHLIDLTKRLDLGILQVSRCLHKMLYTYIISCFTLHAMHGSKLNFITVQIIFPTFKRYTYPILHNMLILSIKRVYITHGTQIAVLKQVTEKKPSN